MGQKPYQSAGEIEKAALLASTPNPDGLPLANHCAGDQILTT